MKNLGYIFRRMLKMHYGVMLKKINGIHKKTGKSRIAIFKDMKDCAVKYGAGYMDYDLFEMYNLTDEQRDTYLTRGRNDALVKKYNDYTYGKYFTDKAEFNKRFQAYIRRAWEPVTQENRENVLAFIRSHEVFIAKPTVGSCGRGVEKLKNTDFPSAEACFDYLIGQKAPYLLEEVIVQHEAVSKVYPYAINTVRAVTLYKDGKAHLISTCFRIGNGGKHVDNFNNGGMVTPVDEKTGIVQDRAIDKQKNLYENHPMTGTPIKGFQFPHWDKVVQLVKDAACEIPQMGYLGWDVGFTPDGPCLVEGNDFPGHDLYQLPQHTPNKIGFMGRYDV